MTWPKINFEVTWIDSCKAYHLTTFFQCGIGNVKLGITYLKTNALY